MQVHIAVAKVPKYGLAESGDTVEILERPRGGVTAIMADGQTHGRAAKRVSHMVVAKAAQLVVDGVRDGAVARGVHDHLFAARDGKVSTELTMLSVDFRTKTMVISRNSHVPVFLLLPDGTIERLEQYVEPIGVHEVMKPLIAEYPLAPGTIVLACTDGVLSAGRRYEDQMTTADLEGLLVQADPSQIQSLADRLLARAMELDRGRPGDDMSILTLGLAADEDDSLIRRMQLSMPF
jgi:serine phosphatase RsbU (regulator of sigma subunit)